MNNEDNKEIEYQQYISNHIHNVRLAFEKYKFKLCSALNISINSLEENINRHDQSKYSDEEFDGYRQWFYPYDNEEKNKKQFDDSWEHHYKNNPHHPEYWIRDDYIEDMPPIYIAEMLLDWESMAMHFGNDIRDYYRSERDKKPLSENTKKIIDSVIYNVFGD